MFSGKFKLGGIGRKEVMDEDVGITPPLTMPLRFSTS
jgi:hypothetical protein